MKRLLVALALPLIMVVTACGEDPHQQAQIGPADNVNLCNAIWRTEQLDEPSLNDAGAVTRYADALAAIANETRLDWKITLKNTQDQVRVPPKLAAEFGEIKPVVATFQHDVRTAHGDRKLLAQAFTELATSRYTAIHRDLLAFYNSTCV
jgi:hypothetical protein